MDPLKRLLPERLVSTRRHMGLSQNRLARQATIAVSTLNALESGLVRDFRVSTLLKLARALSVSPAWLLGCDTGKGSPLVLTSGSGCIAVLCRTGGLRDITIEIQSVDGAVRICDQG